MGKGPITKHRANRISKHKIRNLEETYNAKKRGKVL